METKNSSIIYNCPDCGDQMIGPIYDQLNYKLDFGCSICEIYILKSDCLPITEFWLYCDSFGYSDLPIITGPSVEYCLKYYKMRAFA